MTFSFKLDNPFQWRVRSYPHDLTPVAFYIAIDKLTDVTIRLFVEFSDVVLLISTSLIVFVTGHHLSFHLVSWLGCFGDSRRTLRPSFYRTLLSRTRGFIILDS